MVDDPPARRKADEVATASGVSTLYVYATNKDGIRLADTWYSFIVN